MLAIRGVWIRLLQLERRRCLLLQSAELWSVSDRSFFVGFFPLNVTGAKTCSGKLQPFLEALFSFSETTIRCFCHYISILQFENLDLDAFENFIDCLLLIRHLLPP